MPLEHSSSPGAFKRNVSTLMSEVGESPHVQSREQALAIAYATKRRGRAEGGVANYDGGGAVQQVIDALNSGSGSSGIAAIGTTNQAAPSSQTQTAAMNPTLGVGSPSIVPTQTPGIAPTTNPNPAVTAPTTVAPTTTPVAPTPAIQDAHSPVAPVAPIAQKLMAEGGVANRASGGLMGGSSFPGPKQPAPVPWNVRQEARGLHTGAILSAVPGRTDNHATRVPSGSYVLTAQHVASSGQGNSVAGMHILNKMFGGPYGTSAPKLTHGAGAPRAPSPPRMGISSPHSKIGLFSDGGYSEGGARGDDNNDHVGVPVMLAGGEYVIPPWEIRRRWGNLKNGHAVLDAWQMATRKKEIETQKKLPEPAKR